MKRIFIVFLYVTLSILLVGCNFSLLFENNKIDTETLNYISTVIMDANFKVNTKTYRKDTIFKVEGPLQGSGSSVTIKKELRNNKIYYYLLTNSHVVFLDNKYNHEYTIEDIYNNVFNAELVARNDEYDLAILRFQSSENYTIVELADNNPKVGEIVFSVGSPSGKHNIITAGKILAYQQIKNVNYEVIVHEAHIRRGSSGSMLINQDYELVGLNTWGFLEDESDENFVNGGATPVEKIREFLLASNIFKLD